MEPITVTDVQEVRPEVPKRPEFEEECEYLTKRGQLTNLFLSLLRGADSENADYQLICESGAEIVAEIDALDATWAAKKEAEREK